MPRLARYGNRKLKNWEGIDKTGVKSFFAKWTAGSDNDQWLFVFRAASNYLLG